MYIHHYFHQSMTWRFIDTLRPRRNEQHFADDIFKRIFFNENVWISMKISLKCVPKGPINNIPALVQLIAWRRSGDKPLSEPMMVSLPTHICVTRSQWVNKTTTLQSYWDYHLRYTNMRIVETCWWNSNSSLHTRNLLIIQQLTH